MAREIEMDPSSIRIPSSVLAGRLGFKGEGEVPTDFHALFGSSLEKVLSNSMPRALLDERALDYVENRITIGDREVPGELARKHLSGMSGATLLVATLGKDVDSIISEREKEGDTIGSFFMDGIASELVEFFVRCIDNDLRGQKGELGGTRISPGYGDLPLCLNEWMIGELGAGRIGITFVEGSYQLVPRKSISALIGWRCRDGKG